MTHKELANMPDAEVRKLAVNDLYKLKSLNNRNIDCFVSGFRWAVSMLNADVSDVLSDIIDAVNEDKQMIDTEVCYRGSFYGGEYTEEESKKLGVYEKYLPALKELQQRFSEIKLMIQ